MDMIYFDHAATSPLHPRSLEAMMPYLTEHYGNASSLHAFGREAKLAVSRSRDTLAQLLACEPAQLIFTGSGTEADNAALFGAMMPHLGRPAHVITWQTEHHAVLHSCRQLERFGFKVTYLPVDSNGMAALSQLESAIRDDTVLISLMFGNNETGTLQPVAEIGELARKKGVLFHVDAVQALGMEPIQLDLLPVDLMSFSAHKINGPKGVGLLYSAKGVKLAPFVFGGAQERRRRAGTENTAGIVGFAAAAELAVEGQTDKHRSCLELRTTMRQALQQHLPQHSFHINGHPDRVLPHILNISFRGVDSETMLMHLDLQGIAAASGSACSSGSLEPSHVLQAMELTDELLRSAVRFSFGFGNNLQQIQLAAKKIATIYSTVRYNK